MAENVTIDYGPLTGLIGIWEGSKGLDVAPEPEGVEKSAYFETISFEVVGDVNNAKSQVLAVIRYHQVVSRKINNKVFHDETGYWIWDAKEKIVMHSLVIPRAVCVLAGGKYTETYDPNQEVNLTVSAKLGDPDWGILQSPFMRDHARTVEFRHNLLFKGNHLSYSETTVLEIYGKTFDHTDKNTLTLKK